MVPKQLLPDSADHLLKDTGEMTDYRNALVWLSADGARVVEISERDGRVTSFHNVGPLNEGGAGNTSASRDLDEFFDIVVESCRNVERLLLVGAEVVTNSFRHRLQTAHPTLAARLVGSAAGRNPSERELLEFGRNYFRLIERTVRE